MHEVDRETKSRISTTLGSRVRGTHLCKKRKDGAPGACRLCAEQGRGFQIRRVNHSDTLEVYGRTRVHPCG